MPSKMCSLSLPFYQSFIQTASRPPVPFSRIISPLIMRYSLPLPYHLSHRPAMQLSYIMSLPLNMSQTPISNKTLMCPDSHTHPYRIIAKCPPIQSIKSCPSHLFLHLDPLLFGLLPLPPWRQIRITTGKNILILIPRIISVLP